MMAEHPSLQQSTTGRRRRRSTVESTQFIDTVSWVLGVLEKDSVFFQQNPPRPLPHLESSQIEIGQFLGEGEFGVVLEVKEFKVIDPCHCSVCLREKVDSPPIKKVVVTGLPPLNPTHRERKGTHGSRVSFADVPITIEDVQNVHNDNVQYDVEEEEVVKEVENGDELEYSSVDSDSDDVPIDFEQKEERGFMRAHCMRGGLARYAVKRIRLDVPEDVKEDAAIDLATEAKFLASLSHPNIVKMRAVVGTPGLTDFLMVMDRLYATLNQTIDEWRKSEKQYKGILGHFGRRQEDLDHVRKDRMVALYDIARAIRYLHSNNIIYRDLKPENIGFDVRGDAKLFDLGLAKELKRKDLVTPPDAFEASGMTGSRRYMAPEVMALELPFAKYDFDRHFSKVVLKGERPKRLSFLSPMVALLLEECWDGNPSSRPNFKRINDILKGELSAYESASGRDLNDRTTHLMDMSYNSRFGFHRDRSSWTEEDLYGMQSANE